MNQFKYSKPTTEQSNKYFHTKPKRTCPLKSPLYLSNLKRSTRSILDIQLANCKYFKFQKYLFFCDYCLYARQTLYPCPTKGFQSETAVCNLWQNTTGSILSAAEYRGVFCHQISFTSYRLLHNLWFFSPNFQFPLKKTSFPRAFLLVVWTPLVLWAALVLWTPQARGSFPTSKGLYLGGGFLIFSLPSIQQKQSAERGGTEGPLKGHWRVFTQIQNQRKTLFFRHFRAIHIVNCISYRWDKFHASPTTSYGHWNAFYVLFRSWRLRHFLTWWYRWFH